LLKVDDEAGAYAHIEIRGLREIFYRRGAEGRKALPVV
jgi:hypothetical protein